MRQLRREIRNVPIVFVSVSDPVTHGFVASLARPGGNATGFVTSELSFSAKWLELLKEIAPTITRAAIIRDPDQVTTAGRVGAIQTAAASLRVELSPIDIRDTSVMERAVAAFASQPGGGIIVPAGILAQIHRKIIVAAAARNRLPAVYPYRFFVADGGLVSFGPDLIDQYRRAAEYVDRILRGEKPADLPVQNPIRYELVINLNTAKALGLTIPQSLMLRADEVIE
jgi:putative ABC transport system substrate-binding protein